MVGDSDPGLAQLEEALGHVSVGGYRRIVIELLHNILSRIIIQCSVYSEGVQSVCVIGAHHYLPALLLLLLLLLLWGSPDRLGIGGQSVVEEVCPALVVLCHLCSRQLTLGEAVHSGTR